jgi:hypothetical protein
MVHAPKSAGSPARSDSPRPPTAPVSVEAPALHQPIAAAAEAIAAKPTRIQVGDKILARLSTHPRDVRDLAVKLLTYLYEAGVASPLGAATFPVNTHRDAETAQRALDTPALEDRRGKPPSFGSLAIIRPGLGNFGPSGAFVFRLSRYAERVIVAYANGLDARFNHLRPSMMISGVPVPPELRGRLLEIGKPDRLLLSLEQASDLFAEQFAAMKGSPLLGDVDPLAAGALVVAHSTGGLDAPLTRRRLAEAGFPTAISRIIAIGTPFKGSTTMSEALSSFITALAGAKMNSDEGRKAVRSIDPKNVQKRVPREVAPLIDVSVAGKIGPPCKFRQTKKGQIEASANSDIRPMLRFVALESTVKTIGDLKPERVVAALRAAPATPLVTDGLVTVEATKFGRKTVVLAEPRDHAGLFEDPEIVDRAVKALIS